MKEDIVEKMFPKEKIIDGYDKWVDDLQKENFKLTKECNQLETNWNELKKLLEERIKYYKEIGYDNTYLALQIALNQMQELEGNNEQGCKWCCK